MRVLKGRAIISVVLFLMGLASLARSLSHPGVIHPSSAITKLAGTISARTFHRAGTIVNRPIDGTQSRRISSLLASNLQSPSAESTTSLSPLNENYFLNQVEVTISNVFESCGASDQNNVEILDLPVDQREAFGVATNVDKRLRSLRKNNDCPRCWMQRYHCICEDCGPVEDDRTNSPLGGLKRIFLVVHHKEIGLKVDTAKLILAAFPFQCELVVGGIGPEHQLSMNKMLESVQDPNRTSLLLFPDETANTLEDIVMKQRQACSRTESVPNNGNDEHEYDLIVLDGTWAQARKFHSRYFPLESPTLQRVKLSEASVELLHGGSTDSGHQLRRHDIPWRQVGTFEAFRLFLRDWSREFPSNTPKEGKLEFWEQIESYQRIANEAALRELGPPRS